MQRNSMGSLREEPKLIIWAMLEEKPHVMIWAVQEVERKGLKKTPVTLKEEPTGILGAIADPLCNSLNLGSL